MFPLTICSEQRSADAHYAIFQLQNATNHRVEECNLRIEVIRNRTEQHKHASRLTSDHRNNNPRLLAWYAECLKESVKRDTTQALTEQEALGCEAGGGYDSSSSSYDVRNLPDY
jgi:hypothetical protein